MLRRRWLPVVLSLMVAFWTLGDPGIQTAQAQSIVDEVEGQIICQCGCTYTLEACASAMGCSVGDQMRAEIADMGARGMTRAQILDYYVSKYGETVLAAPTKRGFNLVAWVIPFAALAAGGGAVYLFLQAWSRRRRPVSEEEAVGLDPELNRYAEQVDRELEQVIRREESL